MRVSAVMTAYNQASFVGEALESVLRQDYRDFEVIVVDDGSTDETSDVVRGFGDRVRLIQRANGGLGAARNTGIDAARGEYVAFCDADDVHLPWRFGAHAALLDQSPAAAVVFSELSPYVDGKVVQENLLRTRWLGPNRRPFEAEIERCFGAHRSARERKVPLPERYLERPVYQGRVPELILGRHIAWGGASMFRRAALRAIGGHDATLRRAPDWYLVGMLSKFYELIFLDVPVLWYRVHESQLTKNEMLGAECCISVVHSVWKSDPVFYAKYHETVDQAEASYLFWLGKAALDRGEIERAEVSFRRSIRALPRQKRVYLEWAKAAARVGWKRLVTRINPASTWILGA